MFLRIKFCNHQRAGRTKLLKSLYPKLYSYYSITQNIEYFTYFYSVLVGVLVRIFIVNFPANNLLI